MKLKTLVIILILLPYLCMSIYVFWNDFTSYGMSKVYGEDTIEWKIYPEEELVEFDSCADLIMWLALDDINRYEYKKEVFDCDDFAYHLMKRAIEDGYIMSIHYCEIDGQAHLMNVTKIGNILYTIDPQKDEVSRLCLLDIGE